jgi:hypothetical protein
MKHLINREDYIKEYLHLSNQIENENELNEGLLDTVFGGLKMLFKKDWANVKCKNASVLNYLKDIDKNLGGYTMTKMQFSGECTTIRQNVADYFTDILDYKLSQVEDVDDPNKFLKKEIKEREENKDGKGVAKKLNIKDKTILDSIDKYKKNIDITCKKSPKLREYADLLLNSVDVFVDRNFIAALEKKGVEKEKLEELNKKMEEREKELGEIRKKMDDESKKAGDEAIKKINKERDDVLKKIGVTPMSNMDGDKAVDTISKEFDKMMGEFKSMKLTESYALPNGHDKMLDNVLNSDTMIGIKNTLETLEWNLSKNSKKLNKSECVDRFLIRVILSKINTVFGVVAKNKDMFKGVPSASVQAMMISLSNVIIYGFMGEKFDIEKDDDRLSLITKCAIDSDATIGFNLPLIDPKKPDNGNFFVSIMNQFKTADISSKEVNDVLKTTSDNEKKLILKSWGKFEKDKPLKDSLSAFDDWGKNMMKEFRQRITKLFDVIVKKAKDLKAEAEKNRETEAAKAQQESDAENNK